MKKNRLEKLAEQHYIRIIFYIIFTSFFGLICSLLISFSFSLLNQEGLINIFSPSYITFYCFVFLILFNIRIGSIENLLIGEKKYKHLSMWQEVLK